MKANRMAVLLACEEAHPAQRAAAIVGVMDISRGT